MKPFSRLRDLLEKSTPGTWIADSSCSIFADKIYIAECCVQGDIDDAEDKRMHNDSPFIAEAHNTLPKVLEALDIALKIVKVWDNLGDEQATEALAKIKELGEK